jgi:hypothetical protein
MGGIRNGGILVGLTLGTCLVASSQAYADNNHNGNGAYNHNAFSIRSPTRNGGVQAISNANAGGQGSSRNALCKKTRFCHIQQRTGFAP